MTLRTVASLLLPGFANLDNSTGNLQRHREKSRIERESKGLEVRLSCVVHLISCLAAGSGSGGGGGGGGGGRGLRRE